MKYLDSKVSSGHGKMAVKDVVGMINCFLNEDQNPNVVYIECLA